MMKKENTKAKRRHLRRAKRALSHKRRTKPYISRRQKGIKREQLYAALAGAVLQSEKVKF